MLQPALGLYGSTVWDVAGSAAEQEQQTGRQRADSAQQESAAHLQSQEVSSLIGLDTQQADSDRPQHGEAEAQRPDVQPAQVTPGSRSSEWLDSMMDAVGADAGAKSEAAAAAAPAAGSWQAGKPFTGTPQLATAAAAAADAAQAGDADKGTGEARLPAPVLPAVEQMAAAPAPTRTGGQPLPAPEVRLGLQAGCSLSSRLPSSPLAQMPLATMATIPDLEEGLQLSQHFAATSQQLQADMDALKLSIGTLDFGEQAVSCTSLARTKRTCSKHTMQAAGVPLAASLLHLPPHVHCRRT